MITSNKLKIYDTVKNEIKELEGFIKTTTYVEVKDDVLIWEFAPDAESVDNLKIMEQLGLLLFVIDVEFTSNKSIGLGVITNVVLRNEFKTMISRPDEFRIKYFFTIKKMIIDTRS